MSQYTIAIYPGTFDPLTVGHIDLIRRSAALFGTVVVAVATAHHKKTLFSLDARIELAAGQLDATLQSRVFQGLRDAAEHVVGEQAGVAGDGPV